MTDPKQMTYTEMQGRCQRLFDELERMDLNESTKESLRSLYETLDKLIEKVYRTDRRN